MQRKRILLKISGEALKGEDGLNSIESKSVKKIADKIKEVKDLGLEIVIVLGGGNIYRGGELIKEGVNSSDSHNLSMLGTVFNGVVLQNFLTKIGLKATVLDPNGINFIEQYEKNKAIKMIEEGNIVICVGGTGNPYFTTDSGGVLRALELDCDFMIKATKVDGVYDSDPVVNPNAKFFEKITYKDFIEKELKVLDSTSIVLAKENSLKIKILNFYDDTAILKAVKGEKVGTDIY